MIEQEILPLYCDRPEQWWKLVMNSMQEIMPFFGSNRMATQYYEQMYAGKVVEMV